MKSKLIAAAVIITLLTFAALVGHIIFLRNQRDKAAAAQVAIEMELEGFKKAVTSTPKEVIKLVPSLVTPEVAKAVKVGTVKPILGATIEAKKTVEVLIPPDAIKSSGEDVRLSDESLTKGLEVKPDNPRVPLHLTFHAGLLVTRIKFGIATEFKSEAGGSVAVGENEPQFFKFEEDEATFEVRVSEEISKALYDHEREGNWLKRHTSLLCPGIGVTWNPLDTQRPVNVGVVCAYGFSWF
jgi:hypothetical protein